VLVDGREYRSIWFDHATGVVNIIDQRSLPYVFNVVQLRTLDQFATAIKDMWVRGAPLIGATAAYGFAVCVADDPRNESIELVRRTLVTTRPTAINLRWALDRCTQQVTALPVEQRAEAALQLAHQIAEDDVHTNRSIGRHGAALIRAIADSRTDNTPVRVLTHCNAGWLATVDFGTATSPVYSAVEQGLDVHVWVDETRPRNQGALTAWEMVHQGVSHCYIADNAGGHLMQRGLVDIVIVGSDRTSAGGDVCNKIGTYLKALAARANSVPFYAALPSSTIDWTLQDGVKDIPIEERDPAEITHVQGLTDSGGVGQVRVVPEETPVENPAFDVTPRSLVTGLITERGVCAADPGALARMYPEHAVHRA